MNGQIVFVNSARVKLGATPRAIPMLLLLGDIVGLIVCSAFTFWVISRKLLALSEPVFYILTPLVIVGLYLASSYHRIKGSRAYTSVIVSNTVVGFIVVALINLPGIWQHDSLMRSSVVVTSLKFFTIWGVILRWWAARWVCEKTEQSRWLILGDNDGAIKFRDRFLAQYSQAKLVVLCELSSLEDLANWASQSWSGVVVATKTGLSEAQAQQLVQLRLQGVPIYRLPEAYQTFWSKIPSSLLQDTWLTFSDGFNLLSGGFSLKLKRTIDMIFSGLLLILLSPLMLLVALLIKLDSPGRVFYSQLRTGQRGKPFRVYKFRSMYVDAEKRGAQWASDRDPRITRVGRFIRMTRIDELPQIWNVLRGEMSLIGPRPERPEFDAKLKQEIPYYDLRYSVKPGITGWAQVMYPYGASVEDADEKLSYDLYYIKNFSLWLDLAIFFKTIRVVLLGKGR